MSASARHLEALIRGLVGERVALYRSSATFKASIDTIARMLPAWVDGIAEKCEESDARVQQAAEMMRRSSTPLTEEFIKGLRDGLPWLVDPSEQEKL